MSLFGALKAACSRCFLMCFGPLSLLALNLSVANAESGVLLPVSEQEFETLFGVSPASVSARNDAKLSALFRDKSQPALSANPILRAEDRAVLPDAFSWVAQDALPGPALLLAGYDGQPDISPLDCAVRAHSTHNLAFRCNAPVALNVPGGDTPRQSFLDEMEAETGFKIGVDLWPGDKDALTGDRLLTARDAVTGMRFTLRYLDQRGFTLADHPCTNTKKWRWAYICLDDDKWNAMERDAQCQYVLDNLLSVEGGSVKWHFAPLPAPNTAKGSLIAIGLTKNPRSIDTASALCRELAAQERVDAMTAKLLAKAPKSLKLRKTPLTDRAEGSITLSASVQGKTMVVQRLRASAPAAVVASARAQLATLWQQQGGAQVCFNADCAELVQVPLPPLPDYRPTAPKPTAVSLVGGAELALIIGQLGN